VCRSSGRDGEGGGGGDEELQAQLLDQISIGIAKAKVKEDLLRDLEERKEGLRQIGDDVRACVRASVRDRACVWTSQQCAKCTMCRSWDVEVLQRICLSASPPPP